MENALLAGYLEKSADRFPERIAVSCKEKSITYRDLDQLSNKVAHAIAELNLSPGSRIGIYLEKSIEAVASIFGVLKAGCTYVPLDVASPGSRTRLVIEDCNMSCLITSHNKVGQLISVLHEMPDLPALLVDEVSSFSSERLNARMSQSEDALAYILYTSGSTGHPKGVMLSHKNGRVFVEWAAEHFEVTEKDVISSHAPFHFDLSIFDIFVSAKCGAKLWLVPSGISQFPMDLASFISEQRISIWYSVPYVLAQMALYGELKNQDFNSLRTIIFAGEVFQFQHLNALKQQLPSVQLFNLYGPTETNVVTFHQVKQAQLTENIPIGVACPYARLEIVDGNLEPVAPGEEGELIVSSESLMKGYWGDTKKTNAAIRKVSLDGKSLSFYFTGDIVKKNSDGEILFINRKDNMIKSRGFRVELGEIESTLAKHLQIAEVMAFAVPDPEIGNRIFAAVSFKNEPTSEGELKEFCRSHLPPYMVPEKILIQKSLPKTASGKLDRRALSP